MLATRFTRLAQRSAFSLRYCSSQKDAAPQDPPNRTSFKCEAEKPTAKPWEDPWKHALPEEKKTYTEFKEIPVNWNYVERLLPLETIPEMPKNCGVTPSGWRPPMNPVPDLPYYIRRRRDHLPPLFLERRRDQLDPKTMEFEYVELVKMNNVYGDVFACEKDLRVFLEAELGHPVATHVDELKGKISVKGAERSLIERFIFEKGF